MEKNSYFCVCIIYRLMNYANRQSKLSENVSFIVMTVQGPTTLKLYLSNNHNFFEAKFP